MGNDENSTMVQGAVAVITDVRDSHVDPFDALDTCRFLMLLRCPDIPVGGQWCLPGGHIEPGETGEQAAVREAYEEAGLTVEPLRKVWDWTKPDNTLRLHWYLVRAHTFDVRLHPREACDYRWLTLGQIRHQPDIIDSTATFFRLIHTL